jgi:hypothetical protein
MGVDSGGSLSVIISREASRRPNGRGIVQMVYLSGLSGMLVARLDAIEFGGRVLRGSAQKTGGSSAEANRDALLATKCSIATALPVTCGSVGSVGGGTIRR